MSLPPHTGVIVLAAGSGSRFGGDKMRVDLGGRPVVEWSLNTFKELAPEALVLVGSEDLAPEGVISVAGGSSRRGSVLNGLKALPASITRVLIHDAARPGVSAQVIMDVAAALETHPAALPVLPVTDTIRQSSTTLDRATLSAAQTPQGFHRDVLESCLTSDDATDEIQSVEAAGHSVAQTKGCPRNLKITQAEDLPMLASLLAPTMTVTGMGFDVHRFCNDEEAEGRTLVLGGLKMPGERPLAGHSDADVLLHALTDAIYGALGEGDIGKHFPPSDMSWKDQDSVLFLEHALERVTGRGGRLIHADLTLICETPKLRPVEDAMKARLVELLGLPGLGLKATTTERLGFTGRGEGIAAQVVVSVELPRG